MPNRVIKDKARYSETLHRLSAEAERMFWRLVTVADDFGRFNADPRVLRATCFPLDDGSISLDNIRRWFEELSLELVATYTADGKNCGVFVTWSAYQSKRAKESKFPAPPDGYESCKHLLADDPENRETRIEKRETRIEKREAARGRATKHPQTTWPDEFTLSDSLTAYAVAKGMPADSVAGEWDRFQAYHQARGSQFASWPAAWRTWCSNYGRFNKRPPDVPPNGGAPQRGRFDRPTPSEVYKQAEAMVKRELAREAEEDSHRG